MHALPKLLRVHFEQVLELLAVGACLATAGDSLQHRTHQTVDRLGISLGARPIVDPAATLVGLDQPGLLEHLKVPGDSRFRQIQ